MSHLSRTVQTIAATAFATLIMIAGLGIQQAKAASAAESFAQTNIEKGYAVLNNASLADAERARQFREFILGLTDMRRIAVFTLGPYSRDAKPADVDAFADAFRDY